MLTNRKAQVALLIATAIVAASAVVAVRARSASAPVTASSVAAAMIKRGLPASVAFTYTAENDPNKLLGRQGGYTSKVALQDRRLPAATDLRDTIGGGGSVECFPDATGASTRYNYIRTLSDGFQGAFDLGDGYDYLQGRCVLRLDSVLTPSQALEYRQAFQMAARS